MGRSEPITVRICPPLVQYDQAFRDRAADERDALPPDDPLGRLVDDYGTLRQKLRDACMSA